MIIEFVTKRVVNKHHYWVWAESVIKQINESAGEEILTRESFETLWSEHELHFEIKNDTTRTKNRIRILKP